MRLVLTAALSVTLLAGASMASSQTVQVPSAVPPSIAAELGRIGPVVAPPPTEKLYAPLAEREP